MTSGPAAASDESSAPQGDGRPRLHVEHSGEGPPLLLAHGFTQTGRLWGRLGGVLEQERSLLRVDLPGHAGSAAVHAGLWDAGRLLLDVASDPSGDAPALGNAPIDLLGYSLGARVALHAALARPELVGKLVLVSAHAGIEDDGARARRRADDEALAGELEESGDVPGFLRRWLGRPMFAQLDPAEAGINERARNTAAGLASSLRATGLGVQEPLWPRLGDLHRPVLVIAGMADGRYCSLAERLAAVLPNAAMTLVPGAGHAVHLHQPALAARVVASFLAGA